MQISLLDDGRLHLNDGPIDLILFADAAESARRAAFGAAISRFSSILDELCAELSYLRSPARPAGPLPFGAVARRMVAATRPLSGHRFITPMAAVAGAVADEVLKQMLEAASLQRAYVNNGGDIAVHIADGAALKVGLVDRPDRPSLFAAASLKAAHGVCGVATSGWRGRSFSLGIADAVTVLGVDAARADAAATLIANAVDLPGHSGIFRTPANQCDPQSDLGDRLVTRSVGALSDLDVARALAAGETEARRLLAAGAIVAASMRLRGATRVVGRLPGESSGSCPSTDSGSLSIKERRGWRLTSANS